MPRCRRCRYPNCHGIAVLPMHYCKTHASNEQAYLQSRQKWAHKSKHYNFKKLHNSDSKDQYRFYQSTMWRKIRLQVLERDKYLCQYCLTQGVITEARTVDHIVGVRINPALKEDLTNLASICFYCHETKTIAEQKYFKNPSTFKNVPITVKQWVEFIRNVEGN